MAVPPAYTLGGYTCRDNPGCVSRGGRRRGPGEGASGLGFTAAPGDCEAGVDEWTGGRHRCRAGCRRARPPRGPGRRAGAEPGRERRRCRGAPSPATEAAADGPCRATVLIGDLAGVRSPAVPEVDLLGVELAAVTATDAPLPVDAGVEHGVIVLTGEVAVGGERVGAGVLAYLGRGRDELVLGLSAGSRALLARRQAVRGGPAHVVELRRPHPRRDRGGLEGLGGRCRPLRPGRLRPGEHPGAAPELAA